MVVGMRCFVRLVVVVLALVTGAPGGVQGQQPGMPEVGVEKLTAFTRAYIEISAVRDELYAELGRAHDAEGKAEIRERLNQGIVQVLQQHEMTREEYDRITFIISADAKQREAFDRLLTELAPRGGG